VNDIILPDLRSSLCEALRASVSGVGEKMSLWSQPGGDYVISSDTNLIKEEREMTEKKKGRAAAKLNPGPEQPPIKAAEHFTYFKENPHLAQVGKTFNFAGETEAFLLSTEKDEELSIITPYGNLTIVLSKIELYNLQRSIKFHFKADQPVYCRKDGRTYIPKS
jgi:hypothetical protein